MKKLILFFLFSFFALTQMAKATAFYTAANGDPNNVNNWWDQTNGTGNHPASFIIAGNTFNVQSGHTMTGASTWTVSGAGSKVIVKTGGQITSGAFNHVFTLDMETGGYYLCNHTTYGSITFGTLDANSTFEVSNASITPRTASITYGNFIWNSSGNVSLGGAITIAGDLTCKGAGELRLVSGVAGMTHTVSGNVIISGGILVGTQAATSTTLSIGKGFSMTSGTYKSQTSSGVLTINFTGTGSLNFSGGTVTNANQIVNINNGATITVANNWTQTTSAFTVNSGGILDCGTKVISGTGSVVVASGGTLRTGHSTGVASNITTTTKTFSSGHKLEWNGSGAQTMGLSGLTITTPALFTISNTGGTVTADANVTFGNTASFVQNVSTTFDASTFTYTFGTSGTATFNGIVKTGNANGFSGASNTTVVSTNTPTVSLGAASTVEYTSGSAQAVSGRTDYYNLTLTGAGTKSMGGNVSLNGVLALTGAGNLVVGANTLTNTSNAPTRTSGSIDASNASATVVFSNTGSVSLPASTFTGNIKNITVSGSGGVLTIGGAYTVTGTASISSGATLTLGTNNLTGSGGSSVLAGTGTISLDAMSQISGFTSTTFSGTYYLTGTNPNVPAGTYGGLTVNGGGATLTGNVSISGTLAINGAFALGTNKLTLTGNSPIRTAGSIDASTGEIEFNASTTITVPASTFSRGNINNLTMTGSGLVTFNDNENVTGTLTLTNGFLDMGANTLTLGTSTASEGTYSRSSGTIRGSFKRWIASGGSTKEFPLDNGSGALSMATITFASLGTGGTLTATFHTSGSGTYSDNGGIGYLPTDATMSNVNLINLAPQYWTVSAGDGLATPSYTADFTGDGIPNVSVIAYIAVVKRGDNSQPWTWVSNNHTTTTAGPVLHYRNGTSFSDFGVGGNQDNLLPVELSGFTSAVVGRDVNLNWTTTMEQNNSGFDIERKSTTTSWTKIANVGGHGTVNTSNSYSYRDANVSSGKYSYRLKQIDFNGNYKYYNLSNEVIIGTPSKYTLAQNFPNPFNPSTSISYEIPTSNLVTLKIYDMVGKEVASLVNENQEAGFYTVKFDASKLSSGIYFYKITANDFSSTKKLMLIK